MPELPEVETIRRGLKESLVGHKILSVEVRAPKLFIGDSERLVGQTVLEIERRAKIMVWKLSKQFLLIHLKMTGQLIFIPKEGKHYIVGGHPDKNYSLDLPHKHSHVIIEFDHGTLYYNDLRKFGWIKVIDSEEEIKPHVEKFGPEYDWPEFTLEYFKKALNRRPKTTIKQALLDQTIIAGLGNIYSDEVLFLAKVLPDRKIASLSDKEITEIYKNIPKVLNLSLKHGGTSAKDYRKSDGSMGTYLVVANVYGRAKQPCKVCGTPIESKKIAARTSAYCPKCQN